jgi:membrane-associated protein
MILLMSLFTFVALSGILGNVVGYWFGLKSGYYLYNKQDSFGSKENI